MIKRVPSPTSGGLILSYKCSAECLHCMYASSPGWSADWISQDDLEKLLSQLAGRIRPSPYGADTIGINYGLHFTGGEPFLNFELLCKAVEIADELRIPSTFVETNCYWCSNDRETREKMKLLKEKGLKGFLISINPFYVEYVPFERTERGVKIGQETFGRNLEVYQSEYYRRFKNMGIQGRIPFKDYLEFEEGKDFTRNVEFFLMGRAVYKLGMVMEEIFPKYKADHFFNEPCRPSFLRNWHNHFDNYGNYMPGYCAGISFGDCRELEKLLDAGVDTEEYPVLALLMEENMEGLLQFAKALGYKEFREGYCSKCHLCMDIRKHLAGKGTFKELKPAEFYSNLE